jgi:amidase
MLTLILAYQFVFILDNYEQLEGAPCSVQLFTTTMRDEECLQIAKQIDEILRRNE